MSRNSDLISTSLSVVEELRATDRGDTAMLAEHRDAIRRRLIAIVFGSDTGWEAAEDFLRTLRGTDRPPEALALVWPSSVLAADRGRLSGLLNRYLGVDLAHISCMNVRTFQRRAADQVLPVTDLEDLAPPSFVAPTIRVNGSQDVDALDFLADWARPDWTGPPLVVLLAPAGVGKTTLATAFRDRLLRDLHAQRDAPRPLLLRAETWRALRLDQASLDDVWLRAIGENYQAALPLEMLRVFIQSGSLLPILDGFDELCSHGDAFTPSETYAALLELVGASPSARIVVTAREGYWKAVVGQNDGTHVSAALQQFGHEQRERYLEKRFPGPAGERRRADVRSLLDRLTSRLPATGPRREHVTSLPLFVEILCDAVADDGADGTTPPILTDPIETLMEISFNRERTRRALQLTEAEQRELFSELAVYQPTIMKRQDFMDTVTTLFPPLSRRQREEILPHHQLLRDDGSSTSFKYEFVRDHVRAETLAQEIRKPGERPTSAARSILREEAGGQGAFWEHFEPLVADLGGHLARLWAGRRPIRLSADSDASLDAELYVAGLVHVAQRIATRDDPATSVERRKATDRLFSALGTPDARLMRGAVLSGPLADLNLDRVVFDECLFNNAGFLRCDLAGLRFVGCRFEGTFDIVDCGGGDSVEWPGGAGVSAAAAASFLAQKTLANSHVSRSDVVDIVHGVLLRFRRGSRLKTLERDVVLSRTQRHSELSRNALEALEKHQVIGAHTISGIGPGAGRHIVNEAMQEVLRFLDSRVVGARLEVVVRDVLSRAG